MCLSVLLVFLFFKTSLICFVNRLTDSSSPSDITSLVRLSVPRTFLFCERCSSWKIRAVQFCAKVCADSLYFNSICTLFSQISGSSHIFFSGPNCSYCLYLFVVY